MPQTGARLPRTITMPALSDSGRSSGRITRRRATTASRIFSPTVLPLTVSASFRMMGSSCFITASAPPAASNASIDMSPIGRTALITGTLRVNSSNSL